jgi:hypothetical protein
MEKSSMHKLFAVLMVVSIVPAVFAQGTDSAVQKAVVTLSSVQLQHLRANPVQLVPAPGSGKLLNLISLVGQYKFGSSPYSLGSGGYLSTTVGGAPIHVALTTPGFLDQSVNQVRMNGGSSGGAQSGMENQALMIANDGSGEWTDGDGSVIVTVYYTVVDLQ